MEQTLTYRGIQYVIGSENGDGRAWAIYPGGDPAAGSKAAADGRARVSGPRGSFKQAVFAAQGAIDEWLGAHAD